MAQETDLSIKISADVERAVKGINALRGEVGKLGKDRGGKQLSKDLDRADGSVKKLLGSSISLRGVLAGLGVGLALRAIIRNTIEAEGAFVQLENAVRSTGGAAGYTAPELAAMAGELQNVTTFGDEAIQGVQALLLGFQNIQGPVFRETTELVADLSTRLGRDLKGSAVLVGKALQDPVRGITDLRTATISFSDSQEEAIRKMVKAGDIAGAQRVILDQLQSSIGGAARAARDTFGGALEGLKNAFGDLLEGKSGLVEAKNAVQALTQQLQDPGTQAAFNEFISLVATAAAQAALFVSAVNFMVQGPTDALGKLDAAVEKTDKQLRALRYQLEKPRALRGGLLSGQEFFASDERINARIADLTEERRQLLAEFNALLAGPAAAEPGAEAPRGAGFEAAGPNEDFLKANADLERRIALLGQETEYQKVLYEVENGRYKDLSENEQQALLQAGQRLDALTAEQRAQQDAAAAEKQYNDELDRGAEALRNQLNPYRELEATMERLREAYARGKLSLDEWLEAQFVFQESFDNLSKTAETKTDEITQFTIQAARDMQTAFANGFFNVLNGEFDNLGEEFSNLLKRMAAELAASQLLNLLFGASYTTTGELGGLFGSLFHGGGTVGDSAPQRAVSPLAFVGAPRLHSGGIAGLSSDEVPAILKRGEVVMTPDQFANRGQPVSVQIENRGTPISAQSADVRFDTEGMVVKIITEDAQRGGKIINTLRRSLRQ